MLLQFSVENYLSFGELTTFSMRAGKDKDHPGHVLGGKFPAVKGAAIYGANAAGKSNLVLAMGFARDLIVKGRALGQAIPVRPFGLGGDKRASGFHWQFVHAGQLWSYGFDVTGKRIVEEYLFARGENGGTEKKWFERTTDEAGTVKIEFGAALRGAAKGKLAQRLELIAENLRAEQPFLTHAIENRVEPLRAVWRWFSDVTIIRAESAFESLIDVSVHGTRFLAFASELLRFADTGIQELLTERKPFRLEDAESDFADVDYFDLEGDVAILEKGQMLNFDTGFVPRAILRDEYGEIWSVRFKTKHVSGLILPFECESEGTQRLLHLAPVLFTLSQGSYIFVVDELDRRLHTLLVQEFVKIALGDTSKGQLIFTTHDTNLLDNWLLRRDEIWFVQKENGASSLSSLAQFKVRADLDYEKAYLRGNFDGRPYFAFSALLRGIDGTEAPPTEDELRKQLSGLDIEAMAGAEAVEVA